jgi:hypothetical protein
MITRGNMRLGVIHIAGGVFCTFVAVNVAMAQTSSGPPAPSAASSTSGAPAAPPPSSSAVPAAAASSASAVSAAPDATPAIATAPSTTAGTDPCPAECGKSNLRIASERTGVVGVRVSTTRVRGTRDNADAWAVALAGRGEGYASEGLGTGRATHSFVLGGGSGGFEGALEVAVALGVRAPFTPSQGPFLRIGFAAGLGGNDVLYHSYLELPQGQAGYQYVAGPMVFEIAAHGGPILTGRYNGGDGPERRTLGRSFEYGGHTALHLDPFAIHLDVTRFDPQRSGYDGPLDRARGDLCAYAGDFAACLDLSLFRGNVEHAKGALPGEARSLYGGLLLGVAPREEKVKPAGTTESWR